MERTLLLASSYEPLDVISWQDAIRLLTLGKVEILEEYDQEIRSTYLVLKMPAVVRLVNFLRRKKNKVKFSRAGIYARDKYSCQYCGKKANLKSFTFDHVIPKSRGGKTCWENIVTCCSKCNCKKGNRTPQEAGLSLLKAPIKPNWLPAFTIRISQSSIPQQWQDYMYWTMELTQD